MLQAYSAESDGYYESGGKSLGFAHYLGILKRRIFYFAIPFIVVLVLGACITAIQRPLYQATGKILVASQEIPTDLVRPTVMELANQRIQVIQQRIMTRDHLLALVNKYGVFAKQRQWMSPTELLDLMRERTKFELIDINRTDARQSTIAFTVSFEYEVPAITLNVTNDLLTLILAEDARNRTDRATETTGFLALKSQRLQGELARIEAQIIEKQVHPLDEKSTMDPARTQVADLAKLKEELAQNSSIYSPAHPRVIALKKKIAAMEELVAKTPAAAVTQANGELFELSRRRLETEKNLELNNRKLEDARLGEKLERDQRSERLQVIEQPIFPTHPIKPNRMKFLALAFALSVAAGAGAIFLAEFSPREYVTAMNSMAWPMAAVLFQSPTLRPAQKRLVARAD